LDTSEKLLFNAARGRIATMKLRCRCDRECVFGTADYVSGKLQCPTCGHIFPASPVILRLLSAFSRVITLAEPAFRKLCKSPRFPLFVAWLIVLAGCVGIGFMPWNTRSPPVLLLVGTACMIGGVAKAIWSNRPKYKRTIAIGAFIVWVVICYRAYATWTHTEHWKSDSGVEYFDTYHYDRHLERSIRSDYMHASGPMAGEVIGKPHGRWSCWHKGTDYMAGWHDEEYYWYGEKISEGEWHLRNDGRRSH
jgi:hypothetical protein